MCDDGCTLVTCIVAPGVPILWPPTHRGVIFLAIGQQPCPHLEAILGAATGTTAAEQFWSLS